MTISTYIAHPDHPVPLEFRGPEMGVRVLHGAEDVGIFRSKFIPYKMTQHYVVPSGWARVPTGVPIQLAEVVT